MADTPMRGPHVPKLTLPYAILMGMALQFAGAVWWASNIDQRVSHVEEVAIANARVLADRDSWGETLARLDERSSAQRESLARIEARLERRND